MQHVVLLGEAKGLSPIPPMSGLIGWKDRTTWPPHWLGSTLWAAGDLHQAWPLSVQDVMALTGPASVPGPLSVFPHSDLSLAPGTVLPVFHVGKVTWKG